jgi:hypothetical protein
MSSPNVDSRDRVEGDEDSVAVAHNYTSVRHTEWHVQGGDHIMLLGQLHAGRLRRDTRHPLCWTPFRAKDLREFPHLDQPEDRWPTCKACLRTAYRLAGREPSERLMSTRGRRWLRSQREGR